MLERVVKGSTRGHRLFVRKERKGKETAHTLLCDMKTSEHIIRGHALSGGRYEFLIIVCGTWYAYEEWCLLGCYAVCLIYVDVE
jgi:hypothetical protein